VEVIRLVTASGLHDDVHLLLYLINLKSPCGLRMMSATGTAWSSRTISGAFLPGLSDNLLYLILSAILNANITERFC
jgi:hypothetical protein